MSRFYIAYGSNLNLKQMALRCPSASVYSTGVLIDWTLTFKAMRGPAYATIEPLTGSHVPVVIWRTDNESEKSLDVYEGYPTFYYKENINVLTDDKKTVKGMVYIMNKKATYGIPQKWYIDIIKQGYIDNKLDLNDLFDFTKYA